MNCLKKFALVSSLLLGLQTHSFAYETPIRSISLQAAENMALQNSNEIKAYVAQSNAFYEQSEAQFANLLPQWTLSGSFIYDTPNPEIELPNFGPIPVNIKTIYFVTTELSYPIWDTFSNLNAYKSKNLLAKSQKEDEKTTRLQILYDVRIAYLMVQLALEQLKAIQNSLQLARDQFSDIDKNYRAGYAAKIDWIAAQREVFNYELQEEQKRAEVNSKVKDLFAKMSLPTTIEMFAQTSHVQKSEMGIISAEKTNLKFDSLQSTLEHVSKWNYHPPNETLPNLKSQKFLQESYSAQAESEWVKLLPKLEISARASVVGANIFENKITEVNTFMATVSMPVFDGNRIRHTTAQYRQNALTAQWNHDQIKINTNLDYQKSVDMVQSLKKQQEINKMDIDAAVESAKLYYDSYKAGKSIFINVQNANVQSLIAQVQGANISAQILQYLFELQLLSGKIQP